MISILREFAPGNTNPSERPFKKNTDYEKALKIMVDAEEKLLATLNAAEKVLYEKYAAAQRDFSCFADTEQFVNGYRYGALMMLDVMSAIDELTF